MNKWEVERFVLKGRQFTVFHAYDDTSDAPWECCDGHGPVSDWRSKDSKAPGEMVLCEDHRKVRFYDFAAAVRLARKDGWDTPPYKTGKPGERAARSAMADYILLRGWCQGEWHYIGVIVECDGKHASLWGIESCANAYLKETARELAGDLLREFKADKVKAAETARRALLERAFL